MGNILFRILYGKVPFPGTNPDKVYDDIKHRRITWPMDNIIDEIMSKEAQDLINRMIQISPGNRLGHNLESIAILKQHPFFYGIDFEAISKPDYTGIQDLVLDRFKELGVKEEEDDDDWLPATVHEKATFDSDKVILKGNLVKRNRWGNNQVRFFVLYESGDLMYYKDQHEYKGTIKVGVESKPRKTGKTTIMLTCMSKGKKYEFH